MRERRLWQATQPKAWQDEGAWWCIGEDVSGSPWCEIRLKRCKGTRSPGTPGALLEFTRRAIEQSTVFMNSTEGLGGRASRQSNKPLYPTLTREAQLSSVLILGCE